jgi:aryl carrier-like protein
MNWTDWARVNEPKVKGTWNLHQAFLEYPPLDFFWLASSAVTVVDQPGQGNYKAGCTFTEAFCQYRHSLGLSASVLSICPINDVGYVAENRSALRSVKLQGLYTLGEKEFLESLEASLLNSFPAQESPDPSVPAGLHQRPWENNAHIIMGLRSELHLKDPKNPTNWRRDRRMGMYHNSPIEETAKTSAESSGLKQFLQSLPDGNAEAILAEETAVEFLALETGRKIHDFLLKPADAEVDASVSLSQMGFDSLTAIELRRWFRQTFGVEISVIEMMGSGSLKQLGGTVASKLQVKHGQ